MTYDKTSRNKIMAHSRTHRFSETIQKFEVDRKTLMKWFKQEQEGYTKPERQSFYRKMNPELLRLEVLENPDCTLAQLGRQFEVSESAVYKALIKLGFSF